MRESPGTERINKRSVLCVRLSLVCQLLKKFCTDLLVAIWTTSRTGLVHRKSPFVYRRTSLKFENRLEFEWG
jgi:hypothetical protein